MDYDINAYSSDEEARRPKIIRYRPNHFEEWDRTDFFSRFRLQPRTVENLIEEVRDVVTHPTNWNNCLSAENQVLLALRYYATGSFLSVSGDFCGVHKSTASKCIRRVSQAISALRPNYIYMPRTADEIAECKQYFYNIAKFPRVIDTIDCSHVKIQSPGGENAEIFRNRKQFFSLNVQTIADANLKIQDIVARWPGSSHDSYIFRNSVICNRFEENNFPNSLLLGDSGYPLKPYLITPLLQTRNEAERLFNESHIRTRNVVERSYGVWKRRFPTLALGMRLKLDTIQAVVVATAVLHNIACNENEPVPPVNQEEERAIELVNNNIPINNNFPVGRGAVNNTRNNLIYNYFARL